MARGIWRGAFATCGLLVAAACSQPATHLGDQVGSSVVAAGTGGPVTTSSGTAANCTNASAVADWTLERRAAQLIVIPSLNGQVGSLTTAIEQGVGGVVLLGGTPPATLASQLSQASNHAAIHLMVMVDEEGGGIQRLAPLVGTLPWPREMAATWSVAQVESAVAGVARNMRNLGISIDLAPVVDIDGGNGPSSTDPDGLRSFGADPSTVSQFSAAFIRGLRQGGVGAAVKHFPGLGGASANTDYGPAATLAWSTLRTTALPTFAAAMSAGAAGVMVANASVPGLTPTPAAMSAAVIQQVLRRQLGFSGLVITDSLSAGAISAAHYRVAQAAVAAVEAGDDMVLFGSTLTAGDVAQLSPANVSSTTTAIVSALVGAVRDGHLHESELDQAVLRVLAAKGVNLCAH